MSVILEDKYKKELDFDVINENIELNLNLISNYPRSAFLKQFIELKSEEKLPANGKSAIIDLMKIEQLIDMPNDHMLNLTKLGYEVQRNGGWIKHLNREKANTIRNDKKASYDFKTSKWKAKTFWPLLIFGALGGLYGTIDFITEKIDPKPDMQNEKIELELIELRKMIIEKKKTDSIQKSEMKK